MITIVGLGALGSRVCKALPQDQDILLIDFDFVREENIGVQYPHEVIGMKKVEAARILHQPKAQVLHKHIDVATVGLLKDASIVIDCTDNMITRYIINDYCTREGIPWIHSAMSDTRGTVAAFVPGGACFNCVYPGGHGETCTRNFLPVIADHTAGIAAQEALRVLRSPTQKFVRVLPTDIIVLDMSVRPDCATHKKQFPYLSHSPQAFYITFCSNANCMAAKPLRHMHDRGVPQELTVRNTKAKLYPNGEIHFPLGGDEDTLHDVAKEIYATHFKH